MNLNNQEIYKRCINSEDFAYWVGVVQTDGYFKRQFVKSRKTENVYIFLAIGSKSLPMQSRFIDISRKLFGIKGSLFKYVNKGGFLSYEYKFGCKNLIELFNQFKLDFSAKLVPPKFVLKSESLFGAYIAGIIDGDGDIRISKRKYPQCFIRISGKDEPTALVNLIKSKFNCRVYTERREQISKIAKRTFLSQWQVTEFIISNKNFDFIRKYIIKHVSLPHKKNRIIEYFKIRGWSSGFEPEPRDPQSHMLTRLHYDHHNSLKS